MAKIDISEQVVLTAFRMMAAYIGWKSNKQVFMVSAAAGVVMGAFSKPIASDKCVDRHGHLGLNTLTALQNPKLLCLLYQVRSELVHLDHHMFDRYPLNAVLCGYMCGSYLSSLWQAETKTS